MRCDEQMIALNKILLTLHIIIFLDQACTPNLCFSYFSLPIVNPFNLYLSYFIQFSTTPLPLSPYGPPL